GPGTWITPEMQQAYLRLHAQGFAHSAEAWSGGELSGGIYGVALGACFFGESMFAQRADASKVALATLVRQLQRWGFALFDRHLPPPPPARRGAREWPRPRFLRALARAGATPPRRGAWRLDPALAGAGDPPPAA